MRASPMARLRNVSSEVCSDFAESSVDVACQCLHTRHRRECDQGNHECVFDEILAAIAAQDLHSGVKLQESVFHSIYLRVLIRL